MYPHSVSVRQHVTPAPILGRMNASYRLLVTGTLPIGAIAAAVLGEAVGLQAALLVFALLLPASVLSVIFSPLSGLRTLPELARGPAIV